MEFIGYYSDIMLYQHIPRIMSDKKRMPCVKRQYNLSIKNTIFRI